MCRFLIVRSAAAFDPGPLLSTFAEMARLSRAPDGDRQGDGWGVAWEASGLLNAHGTSAVPPERNSGPPSVPAGGTPTCRPSRVLGEAGEVEKYDQGLEGVPVFAPPPTRYRESLNSGWKTHKSLRPIWEDAEVLAEIPATRMFAAHARSASFPDQKSLLEYNEPFVDGKRAFVFNGLVKGVSFPRPLEGRIGAQKIWSLLRPGTGNGRVEEDLAAGVREIEAHAREVQALNIGLVEDDRIAVYSHPAGGVAYYGLWIAETAGLIAVCSEPLAGLPFRPLPSGSVVVL